MKIKEYDTNELLMIANNVTGEYPEKKVRQAKEELYRRGVDDKVIADIMEEKEEAFMKRLDAAARAEKARMDKQNEKNRNVSYRWWELIPMLLFAPFYLVRGEKELVAILLFLPVYLLSRTPVDFSGLFPGPDTALPRRPLSISASTASCSIRFSFLMMISGAPSSRSLFRRLFLLMTLR